MRQWNGLYEEAGSKRLVGHRMMQMQVEEWLCLLCDLV
jgi:hypothetical protein